MPQDKLTKRFVESLPFAEKGQVLYSDTELPGFGLIVGSKSKTYFAQRTVKGRTVRVTIGKHSVFTSEQARTDAKELLVRMARGENPNQTKREEASNAMTLQQAYDAYIVGRKHLAKETKKKLERCKNQWFAAWMDSPLSEITKDMIFKKHAYIGENHGGPTANSALGSLCAIYNFALLTNDALPPNPVLALTKAKSWYHEEVRKTLIKPVQLKPWYEAVMLLENSAVRDFLRLLLFTGMRKMEGLSLNWKNIDLQEKIITVPDTKNGNPLVIPMSDYVYDLFVARKKRTGKSEWVFPSTGTTGHLVEPKKAISQVAKKSGVPFMTHDLRRTFITIAESLDISSYALKRLVNHSQKGDVTSGYIVMNVERLREPMQKIATYILEKVADNQAAKATLQTPKK